jgi:hypothetical protein
MIYWGLVTVEETEGNEGESHVDVCVTCVIDCEERVGEEEVGYEEWKDVKTKKESTGIEEFEIYSIGVH